MIPFSALAVTYAIAFVLFILIDLLWLGYIFKGFVDAQLGHLRGEINWYAVVIFYALYPLALMVFAIYPNMISKSVMAAALLGALFGFFAYVTYDMTNLATLRGWPVAFSVFDIIWGTVLSGSVAALAVYCYKLIF